MEKTRQSPSTFLLLEELVGASSVVGLDVFTELRIYGNRGS
jgi:hypothetical protein